MTERLVVTRFNACVRNPVYLGTLVSTLGGALLLGQLTPIAFANAAWPVTAAFVRWYEEPALAGRSGADFAAYKR